MNAQLFGSGTIVATAKQNSTFLLRVYGGWTKLLSWSRTTWTSCGISATVPTDMALKIISIGTTAEILVQDSVKEKN